MVFHDKTTSIGEKKGQRKYFKRQPKPNMRVSKKERESERKIEAFALCNISIR